MSSTFQTQTLVFNVPFNLVYGTRYLIKSTQPLGITLGIKMYYSGAQYQFNVLSGGSVILDGSIIRQVQLLTNIIGVNIVEGAVNLPARDDVYNRNPSLISISTSANPVPTGTNGTLMINYTPPANRKFEGRVYFFIGPTSSTALSGVAYILCNTPDDAHPAYYVEANIGSVLPIVKVFPLKLIPNAQTTVWLQNTSGQSLTIVGSLVGIESDV